MISTYMQLWILSVCYLIFYGYIYVCIITVLNFVPCTSQDSSDMIIKLFISIKNHKVVNFLLLSFL